MTTTHDWHRNEEMWRGLPTLGTGVLGRRGKDMGDELDHDVHTTLRSSLAWTPDTRTPARSISLRSWRCSPTTGNLAPWLD
jgi:hypothetical protein